MKECLQDYLCIINELKHSGGRRVVLRSFQNLFFSIESEGILPPDNEMHCFALHSVYLPRINAALGEFLAQWNNHSIWTLGGLSPRQLLMKLFAEYL